jgi:dTDP-4-amino-4,6-dideoxygalactose transaminase
VLLSKARALQVDYVPQQRRAFARRVMLFALLKLLAHRLPLLVFVALCQLRGRDHDRMLSQAVRGFAGGDLIRRLRRRPSSPLLRLLDRRLRQASPARIAWRNELADGIMRGLPSVGRPGSSAATHTHWVLPIESHDPDGLVRLLWASGFDATRHASSLTAVLPPETDPARMPRRVMSMLEHMLYLPIFPGMAAQDRGRLVRIILDYEARRARQEEPVEATAAT